MQLAKGLDPLHDLSEHRSGSHRYAMLMGLHGLLLSLAVSEVGIHTYRVSHVKEKITKVFLGGLHEGIAQLISATVVFLKRPHFLSPFALFTLHSSVFAISHEGNASICSVFALWSTVSSSTTSLRISWVLQVPPRQGPAFPIHPNRWQARPHLPAVCINDIEVGFPSLAAVLLIQGHQAALS